MLTSDSSLLVHNVIVKGSGSEFYREFEQIDTMRFAVS